MGFEAEHLVDEDCWRHELIERTLMLKDGNLRKSRRSRIVSTAYLASRLLKVQLICVPAGDRFVPLVMLALELVEDESSEGLSSAG